MQILHPRSVGAIAVAKAQLRAKIIAHENKLAESFIVPHEPRRDAR